MDSILVVIRKNRSSWLLLLIIVAIVSLFMLPGGITPGVVLLGGINGALYALTALGLVLIYRSQKIINFAQAEIGALAVAVAVVMVELNGLNYFLALFVGLIVALATGAIIHLLVEWRFKDSPRMILTVATLGIAEVIGAMEVGFPYLFSRQPAITLTSFSTPFNFKFKLSGIEFTGDHVVAVVASIICLVGLWFFLEKTRYGMAIRGYADSRDRAKLLGIRVSWLSLVTWTLAAGLSAIAAMAAAPASMGNPPDITAIAGPTILLAPLAAAIVGRMEKLFVTAIAAILLGIFQQVIFWSYPSSSVVDVGFLVVIFISLLLQPPAVQREALATGSFVNVRVIKDIPEKLARLKEVRYSKYLLTIIVGVVALLLPPILGQSFALPAAYMAIYAIMTVSLVLLSGWAGQISLGQSGFAGIGAAIVGMFLAHSHVDLLVVLFFSAIAGAIFAVLIGIPALRIPGLFLSVITLAFAIAVDSYFLNGTDFPFWNPDFIQATNVFGKYSTSNAVVLYELSFGILLILLLLVHNLKRSRIKRTLVGIRDNEFAAGSFGISRFSVTLRAFAISGALAGVAAGLIIVLQQGSGFAGFDPELSFTIFVGVVIGGLGSITGGILGAIYIGLTQYYLSGTIAIVSQGIVLIIVLMFFPEGLSGILAWFRNLVVYKLAAVRNIDLNRVDTMDTSLSNRNSDTENEEATIAKILEESDILYSVKGHNGTLDSVSESKELVLEVRNVDASYSNLKVLNDVSFSVLPNTIFCLLGTNGAGKSTILSVISGLMKADRGSVYFKGKYISHLKAEDIVKLGISVAPGGKGVFPSLTVKENLLLAGWIRRKERNYLKDQFENTFKLFPTLRNRLNVQARLLSGGERQMLTIAMSLFVQPELLLIDELSLGLAPIVVAQVVDVIKKLADQNITVVIVEQSLNLASSFASSCSYLERGVVKYTGQPAKLLEDEDIARSVFLSNVVYSKGPKGKKMEGSLVGEDRTVFEISGISKSYGGVSALQDVSIDVKFGHIHGIIGANGAGKTTLLDICSGITSPTFGYISFNGVDITKLAANKRAELGLGRVFQHAYLFPTMTVRETLNVAHERFIAMKDLLAPMFQIPMYRNVEKSLNLHTSEIIEKFNLRDFENALIAELSTGTKRVVELACLFANEPSFILLDEPSSGLAQKETQALADLLVDIHDDLNATMMIIEHDIPMISKIVDNMTCLDLGRVIASGTPEVVLSDRGVIEAFLGTNQAAIQRSN